MIDAKTLRLIIQSGLVEFAYGRVLDGISALRTVLSYCAEEAIIRAEAESLEENYQHMLSFLRQGGNDEKRNEVQAKIQRQGVSLLEQANRAIRIRLGSDLYCNTLSRLKEVYGGQKTLLDKWNRILTPEETSDVQDDLFDLLWTSPFWTTEDTAFWYDFLLKQREMVLQHLEGAIFLSLWEHYDAEKMQLLNLLAESECHRTHIAAVCYLLLLRLRHKELTPLLPSLPKSLLSRKGKQQIAQVQYEMLLMLISEKDMEKEMKEAEALTNMLISGDKSMNINNIKGIIALRGRYLKSRLQRGLDINLSKLPLLHNCNYMRRTSHWFLPFDKTHPLFQSVMIDENGNEKQNFSTLVDLIMDCDVDKMATLYLVANDKDFAKAVSQLEGQELPNIENAVIPEYTFRFIMQDLYRFFTHSPLHSQLINPFKEDITLLEFADFAHLFSSEDCVKCCELLFELGREKQALSILKGVIKRDGASVSLLLLKGRILRRQRHFHRAINCVRSAELLEPENTDILRFLAECYAFLNRFEEELEYLQKLAELLPQDRKIRKLIPITLDKLGRKEEALQLFFKLDYESTENDEDYETILSCIANTALSLDKLDIAERYTKKELELFDSKNEEAQLRMGHIKLLQGDWKDALNHYEQFVNISVKQFEKDANFALTKLNQSQEMLISKGIKREDLLLIHDILQASTDGTSKPISSQAEER